jgi:aldehyde:ferredoxin oxidoreductase
VGAAYRRLFITANVLDVDGKVDPLQAAEQVELSRNLQITTAAIDSAEMCLFIACAVLDMPEVFQVLDDIPNACHGTSLTADDVTALDQ